MRSPRTIYGNSIRRDVLPLLFPFFFHSLFLLLPPPFPLLFPKLRRAGRTAPGMQMRTVRLAVRRRAVILRQCRVCNAISRLRANKFRGEDRGRPAAELDVGGIAATANEITCQIMWDVLFSPGAFCRDARDKAGHKFFNTPPDLRINRAPRGVCRNIA